MPTARSTLWPLIAALVAALAVLWPPDSGKSLAVKALNWLVDPNQSLPRRPSPLAMGMDDDADAVTVHDNEEHAYESMYEGSWSGRMRLRLRDASDPLEPATERPLLIAAAALLAGWKSSVFSRQSGGHGR